METKKKKNKQKRIITFRKTIQRCVHYYTRLIYSVCFRSRREKPILRPTRDSKFITPRVFNATRFFFPSRRAVLWRDKLLSVVSRRTIFRSRNTLRWVAAPSFWNIFKRVTWHFGAVYVIRLHDPLRVVLWTAALINQNQ